ncbi:hypothetical protein HA466_0160900 [Hirschfeldia incana]|nr:hypothetical protein HA466_0160900 [Hirschfeldia incana]
MGSWFLVTNTKLACPPCSAPSIFSSVVSSSTSPSRRFTRPSFKLQSSSCTLPPDFQQLSPQSRLLLCAVLSSPGRDLCSVVLTAGVVAY